MKYVLKVSLRCTSIFLPSPFRCGDGICGLKLREDIFCQQFEILPRAFPSLASSFRQYFLVLRGLAPHPAHQAAEGYPFRSHLSPAQWHPLSLDRTEY